MRALFSAAVVSLLGIAESVHAQSPAPTEWPAYGRDAGGSRFSPVAQVDRSNVSHLAVAWAYNTGEPGAASRSFEATPILVDGTLFLSTPLGRIIALDP